MKKEGNGRRERWYIAAKRADFQRIGAHFGISPVLARLIRNRDLISMEEIDRYLHGGLAQLYSPCLLKDARKGAEILKGKIDAGAKIRIISDYDVDGVSSNYILYQGLRRCSALVDYQIPDRVEDGYGINRHLIERALADGIDTILTCDNGIAAGSEIAYGKSLGMTILVTDHHEVPFQREADGSITYQLPAADAVINPKQKDCSYPCSFICGAVVAYKFIQVLYELYHIPIEETECFLEIAALATVCDVMPLRDENRILVKEGLKRMQHTKIPGLAALVDACGLTGRELSAYHLGFILGPCINASGRLTSAREALDLLLCEDPQAALEKAGHLRNLNEQRKTMTQEGVNEAVAYVESQGLAGDKVLLIYLPDCHESIAGIIAGRLREIYHKPVFVLTKSKGGVKGSGRSIEGYHMFEEMTRVKDCFDQYGGHPMAAGLSMKEERIEELRERLNQNCTLQEADFLPKVHIDIALPMEYVSESFLEEIARMEPFGTGNERPLFAQKDLGIMHVKALGTGGRCVKFLLKDAKGNRIEAIYFGESSRLFEEMEAYYGKDQAAQMKAGLVTGAALDCTYYPQFNDWKGRRSIQIVLKNLAWK